MKRVLIVFALLISFFHTVDSWGTNRSCEIKKDINSGIPMIHHGELIDPVKLKWTYDIWFDNFDASDLSKSSLTIYMSAPNYHLDAVPGTIDAGFTLQFDGTDIRENDDMPIEGETKYFVFGDLFATTKIKSFYKIYTDEKALPPSSIQKFSIEDNVVIQFALAKSSSDPKKLRLRLFIPRVDLDMATPPFVETLSWWDFDWEKTYANLDNEVIGTRVMLECDLQ